MSPFSPHYSPLPNPTFHIQSSAHTPTSLSLSMGPLYLFLDLTLPFLSLLSPSPSLVTVSLLFIYMSLVIFYSLVCFVAEVPLTGEIIWYLSFTIWLISLRIWFHGLMGNANKVSYFLNLIKRIFRFNLWDFGQKFTDKGCRNFTHPQGGEMCCERCSELPSVRALQGHLGNGVLQMCLLLELLLALLPGEATSLLYSAWVYLPRQKKNG